NARVARLAGLLLRIRRRVVHVNELAARERHPLAHFHQCLAAWALRQRRFQEGLGFVLRYHHLRHPAWCAEWVPPLQPGLVQINAMETSSARTLSSFAVSARVRQGAACCRHSLPWHGGP